MSEQTVGSIVGFLRLDTGDFERGIAKAEALAKGLGATDIDVKVKADTKPLERGLGKVATEAKVASSNMSGMNEWFSGGIRSGPVILGAVGAGLALLGPVAGAATAAVGGLTGILGTGLAAFMGFRSEMEKGTALGLVMKTGLGNLKTALGDLATTAAKSMSGGVLGAMSTLRSAIPALNGDVETLGKHLGNALHISAQGLVQGLRVAMPLLLDGGKYAEQFAVKLREFANSREFREFIDYSRRMLPEVGAALGDVAKGVIDLARTLNNEGSGLVEVISVVGKGMSALSTGSEVFKAATKGNVDSINALLRKGAEWAAGNQTTTAGVKATSDAMLALTPVVDEQAAKWGLSSDALQRVKDSQLQHAAAAHEGMVKMQMENDAAGILKTTLDALNGKTLSAADAQNSFESSLVNMGTHVTTTGKTIKFTTANIHNMSAASVALRGQLNGQVSNLQRVVEANGGLANSTGHARQQMVTMRKQIIDNAVAHGVDRKAVTAYVDSLLKIPKTVPSTKLSIDKAAAEARMGEFQRKIDGLHGKTITVTTRYVDADQRINGSRSTAGGITKADGGYISGAGTGTSDSIPAWLSNGEYVINAAATSKHKALLESINAGKFAKGGPVGFASGGQVDFSSIMAIVGHTDAAAAAGRVGDARGRVSTIHGQQAKAVRDLAEAEARLSAVLHNRHATHAQRLAAENAVANVRDRQRRLTGELAKAEGALTVARNQLAAAQQPLISRTDRAAKSSNSVTASFLRDLGTLQKRGYSALALQLMDMGGSEAETLAAQAVKWPTSAKALAADFARSASLNAQAATLHSQLDARVNGPAQTAPVHAAQTRPSVHQTFHMAATDPNILAAEVARRYNMLGV